MEFQDALRRRHMVRRFLPEPVDAAVTERMLSNAVRAPNAGFSQGWAFLVLEAPADRARFWTVAAPTTGSRLSRWLDGMRPAPVLIVVLTSEDEYVRRYSEKDKAGTGTWPVPYWHVDAGMAALLILLTAVDEELGACFFGVPADREDTLRAAFDIPGDYAPTGVIAIGHPANSERTGSPTRRQRKPLDDLVHRGRW